VFDPLFMLDLKREIFKGLEKKVGSLFSLLPLTPNQWTLCSFVFALITLFFLIKNNLILALLFFLVAAFLDFVDGAVARFKKEATNRGAYLDTIVDRYVEAMIFIGFLFLPLPDILLPCKVWIFLCFFGSIITTYSKAAAKEKELANKEIKGGILSRGERIILISLSMLVGIFSLTGMAYLLIIFALLSNLTAVQRINLALKGDNLSS